MSLIRFFVAPATERPAFVPPAPPSVAPSGAGSGDGRAGARTAGDLVVLAAPGDLEVAAGAAAAAVRRRGGAAVACSWPPAGDDPDPPLELPALPSAARCARRLRAHGLEVWNHGATARVALAAGPPTALAQVRRVQAAAGAPIAIVLARRDPVLDVLLREAAEVVVIGSADAGLTALALEQAADLNRSARAVDRPESPVSRLRHRLALRPLDDPGAD